MSRFHPTDPSRRRVLHGIATGSAALLEPSGLHRAAEVEVYAREVESSLARGHMLLNGKWLVHHLAVSRSGEARETCRDVWSEAVREHGGSPAVRAWWQRVVGL